MRVFQEAFGSTMVLFVFLIITTICGLSSAGTLCAMRTVPVKQNFQKGDPSNDNRIHFRIPKGEEEQTEHCNNFCFTLWKEEKTANGSETSIMLQGCWKQPGEQNCESSECVASLKSTKALNNTKFCCCSGDFCNLNIIDYVHTKPVQSSPTISTEYMDQSNSERWMLITIITLVCTVFILFTITMLVYRIYRNNILLRLGKPRPGYTDQFTESKALKSGAYTVDHLKLSTIVGQGKFGSVWQASMGEQDVAVKIYPSHYGTYFQNEKDTYCLPFMEHPSLLHYYGANERTSLDGSTEYLLVLSYAPGGTLIDFLRSHTIDWPSFCKMGLTIVKGLAHLHTDMCKGDKVKPCIAHRDVNSRNILIKADGTCCICDLGLSVQISGSKYYSNGEEQRAETKSINDVGTLRYMAPEILEGAVNLRDCESSLKQIDVYAMGLVLWELVSRCSDVYVPGSEVPPYAQPFEREIGIHPTFEQMQVHVSRNKVRPVLQGDVVDKNYVRLIKETMEDCWDADAEARLTALCIEERLTELQSHRVALYFVDENSKANSNVGLVPSTATGIQTKSTNDDIVHFVQCNHHSSIDVQGDQIAFDNLANLSMSNSIDDQTSSSSDDKSSLKSSESLESLQSTQPEFANDQSFGSNLSQRNYILSRTISESRVPSTATTSRHSLDNQCNSSPEYQTLVSQDSPTHEIVTVSPNSYLQNVINENVVEPKHDKHRNDRLLLQESPRKRKFAAWSQFKNILSNKKTYSYSLCQIERDDSKYSLLSPSSIPAKIVDTNVTISAAGKYVNGIVDSTSSDRNANSLTRNDNERPSTLPLVPLNNVSSTNTTKKNPNVVTRQESLDKFNEIFNMGSNLRDLKDPHMRIKTPGDLPPSVRRMRGRSQSTARFSLYDDRIMCNIFSEEDDCAGKTISNSVPFGMDFGECKNSAKFDSNVTCF